MELPDVPSSLSLVSNLSSSSSDSASSESSPLTSLAPSPTLTFASSPASSISELVLKDLPYDPHVPPFIGKEAPVHFDQPILYLPPLISSLPCSFPNHTHTSTDRVPKITEARLPDIDAASLSLHRALHNFAPLTENYAATSYAEAFNWDELDLPVDDEHDWYCVAFRSIRKPGSESGRESMFHVTAYFVADESHPALYEADRLAHEEAIKNGGVRLCHALDL